jgi:hypothetical protein
MIDKILLKSYVKMLFRDYLTLVKYKVKGTVKECLIIIGNNILIDSKAGKTLKDIYFSITEKEITDKYNIVLSKQEIKYLVSIINKIKSIPISGNYRNKAFEEADIILTKM